MNKDEILEVFNKYKELCDKWDELSLASLDLSNKTKWMESLHKQVDEGYLIYSTVKDDILPKYNMIKEELDSYDIELQDYIFNLLEGIYYEGFNDYHFLYSLSSKLVPIYEKRKDYDRLLQTSLIAGYALLEQARFDKSLEEKVSYYYHKAMNLRFHFNEFKNPRTKYRLIAAYYNTMVVAYDLDIYPSSILLKTYEEFLSLKEDINLYDVIVIDNSSTMTLEKAVGCYYADLNEIENQLGNLSSYFDYEAYEEETSSDDYLPAPAVWDRFGNPPRDTIAARYEVEHGLSKRMTIEEFFAELDELRAEVDNEKY